MARGTPLKLGFIGCGRVTETRHLPALQYVPEAQVVALADVNPDRLKQVADRFHIASRYADFRALLSDPAIEAVAVCAPTQFHVEIALAALDANKHLLIEKPLALGLDESDRLIARASQSPCHVMVGFHLRWHRLVRQARDLVGSGSLGALELLRTAFTSGIRYRQTLPAWRNHRELGGGVLIEMAIHHFDLWRFLLQSEVDEVFAASLSSTWDDEAAVVTARMANGVLAASVFSQRSSDKNEIEIYGQAGRLQVSCYHSAGLAFFPASSAPWKLRSRLRHVVRAVQEAPQIISAWRRGGAYPAAMVAEWRHFIEVIRAGRPVESGLEDARCSLQVMLAVTESAARGTPVKVAEAPRKIRPVRTLR